MKKQTQDPQQVNQQPHDIGKFHCLLTDSRLVERNVGSEQPQGLPPTTYRDLAILAFLYSLKKVKVSFAEVTIMVSV